MMAALEPEVIDHVLDLDLTADDASVLLSSTTTQTMTNKPPIFGPQAQGATGQDTMVEPETTLQRRDGNVSMKSERDELQDISMKSEGIEAGSAVVDPNQAINSNLFASTYAYSQRPMDVNSHQ